MAGTDHIHAEGRRLGQKEGKVAGVRLSIDELVKWAKGNPAGDALEEAADSLAQIADRLEEEG